MSCAMMRWVHQGDNQPLYLPLLYNFPIHHKAIREMVAHKRLTTSRIPCLPRARAFSRRQARLNQLPACRP
jgi:hypothetical protein